MSAEGASIAFQPVEETSTSGRLGPFAMYFPSGFQPLGTETCKWELHTNASSRGDHYLVGRLPDVDLVGQTRSVNAAQLPCRYAIGVLDKSKGTLQYCQIEGGRIVRIEPRARALNYAATDAGIVTEQEDRTQLAAKSRRLVEAFGSTRRKRQLNVKDNARVDVEAVGGSEEVKQLLKAVGDKAKAEKATREEVLQKAQGYKMLPPHNPEATKPDDAYKLDDLIPGAALACLETEELSRAVNDRVFRKELLDSRQEHTYVLSRLDAIQSPGSATGRKLLKAAAYLSALMRMYGGSPSIRVLTRRGGLKPEAERRHIEVEVLSTILGEFYDRHEESDGVVAYARSDQQRTLLLLHILILALALDRYSLSNLQTEALRTSLKITPAQFSTLYRELGCVVKSVGPARAKSLQVALLPPTTPAKPLKEFFPGIKTGGKRQKR